MEGVGGGTCLNLLDFVKFFAAAHETRLRRFFFAHRERFKSRWMELKMLLLIQVL